MTALPPAVNSNRARRTSGVSGAKPASAAQILRRSRRPLRAGRPSQARTEPESALAGIAVLPALRAATRRDIGAKGKRAWESSKAFENFMR